MAGRPEIYTNELASLVLDEISSTSKSLKTICKDDAMPSLSTVQRWLRDETNIEFRNQYARAKEEQADLLAEEILDIADDGSNDLMTITKGDVSYEQENKEVTNRSKLRVEARKWLASKLKAKKYGDKLDVDMTQKIINVKVDGEEE